MRPGCTSASVKRSRTASVLSSRVRSPAVSDRQLPRDRRQLGGSGRGPGSSIVPARSSPSSKWRRWAPPPARRRPSQQHCSVAISIALDDGLNGRPPAGGQQPHVGDHASRSTSIRRCAATSAEPSRSEPRQGMAVADDLRPGRSGPLRALSSKLPQGLPAGGAPAATPGTDPMRQPASPPCAHGFTGHLQIHSQLRCLECPQTLGQQSPDRPRQDVPGAAAGKRRVFEGSHCRVAARLRDTVRAPSRTTWPNRPRPREPPVGDRRSRSPSGISVGGAGEASPTWAS
jgi:hypothetical protein